jgi:anhydro-N-acetylmuramic acid kinase
MGSADNPENLLVGLMSGTSMDGIDAALVRFGSRSCEVLATHSEDYPVSLRSKLIDASRNPGELTVDTLGTLDNWVGECFASAALAVISGSGIDKKRIDAIGSHGQTMRHQPRADRPFTLQIGDPNLIAAKTGITTVADFRRRDLALGGEGAPLAPAFHQWLFADRQLDRAVLNIGGIANLTVLSAGDSATTGFDTGPGNTLLDAWINECKSENFDKSGAWAETGNVSQELLQQMLSDPYLAAPPPKSTGFEYFDLRWIHNAIDQCGLSESPAANDIQASLAEFTASSIAEAMNRHAPQTTQVLACGGGVHNKYLMARLSENIQGATLSSTAEYGMDPDWMEAAAFAWLAMRTLQHLPGNLPSVTGASDEAILGGVFFGTS